MFSWNTKLASGPQKCLRQHSLSQKFSAAKFHAGTKEACWGRGEGGGKNLHTHEQREPTILRLIVKKITYGLQVVPCLPSPLSSPTNTKYLPRPSPLHPSPRAMSKNTPLSTSLNSQLQLLFSAFNNTMVAAPLEH